MGQATTSKVRRASAGSGSGRRGAPQPRAPRRGSRAQRIAASIVVIGLAAAIALLASGVLGNGTDDQPPGPGFPRPTPVTTASSVLKPARSGRVTAWALPEKLVGPRDVAVSADGVVWITEQNRGIVDSFADGTLTRHHTDVFPYVGAFSLGIGPDGAMWFTGYPGGSIARMLPDGTANGFAPLAGNSATLGIAEGEGDAMWVTDNQRSGLLRISSDGAVGQFLVPASVGSKQSDVQPRDIVRGSDGRMWFTDPGTGAVGSVSTGAAPTVTEHLVGAGAEPRSIAVAPDGSLWVTLTDQRALATVDPSDGSATVVPLAVADATLNDLLVAPDGTLWVSEAGPYLLHVRTDGSTIERIKLPEGARYADGIARAADGTIWVAATDANLIVAVASRG
jgi:virginiamycin B lyase